MMDAGARRGRDEVESIIEEVLAASASRGIHSAMATSLSRARTASDELLARFPATPAPLTASALLQRSDTPATVLSRTRDASTATSVFDDGEATLSASQLGGLLAELRPVTTPVPLGVNVDYTQFDKRTGVVQDVVRGLSAFLHASCYVSPHDWLLLPVCAVAD